MRRGQTIFTYFHFAADEELTRAHLESGAVCIAYETVELPIARAAAADADVGGRGTHGGAGGRQVPREALRRTRRAARRRARRAPGASVVILGGGIVGINAAKMAAGMGAQVVILDISLERLRYLSDVMPANVQLLHSNRFTTSSSRFRPPTSSSAAVLIPGAKAPTLVRREDLKKMQPGRVIVDVAVDQGGCVETIKPTTHENPDVRRRRRHPLRRGEHAGRRAAHVHAGADERDAAVRAAAREQGVAAGACGTTRRCAKGST